MAMPSWLTSLQFRLILAFTATLTLALAAVGIFVSVAAEAETDRFLTRNQEFRVGRVHRMVARHFSENRAWDGVQPSLEQAGSFYGRRFVVKDNDGGVIADSHHREGKGASGRYTRGRSVPIEIEGSTVGFLVSATDGADGDGDTGLLASGPRVQPSGPEQVREPLVSRVAATVNKSLLLAGLAVGAVGIVLIAFISRRILAPVQALGGAAQRLGQGDLGQRVPASGPSEIRDLGNTFNTMAENLQAAELQRRNLAADVAHELRTPLSNIQGYLDAVHDGLLQPDQATIATVRQQTTLLVALVEDLRLLALAEAGSLALQIRPESLQDLLDASIEAFRPRAEAKDIRLVLDIAGGLTEVALDRTRISQVVGNLLENAIVNTPEGGVVTVTAETGPSAATISVSDTGPGITPEDVDKVFDRFYRVDPSRSRATGGAGLGLTIARQLIEAHGGAIWVDSVIGPGATFIFTLPLNRDSE